MGSMNYAKYSPTRKAFVFNFVFQNDFDDIIFLLERMREAGVKPECECFDVGHVESVEPLVDLGVLVPPIQFSLIHGVLGGISATARNLAHMASVVAAGSTWGVIAIGREQWAMVRAATALGGNVRVGFEDNFYLPAGDMAESNGALVEAAAEVVRLEGREVASPSEARAQLSLPAEPDRTAIPGGLRMGEVQSEMVANVWKVVVAPGDAVHAGDPLVILESMKMEIPVEAPETGTVSEVRVEEGGLVQEGDVIAVIE
jgi:biotin carboxyl carrier protein